MKTKILLLVALFTLFTAVSAHALSYDSGNLATVSAGQTYTFDFAAPKGNFNSAKFSFDVEKMLGSSTSLLGKTLNAPANGEFFLMSGNTLTYLFTTDFHMGRNMFKLDKFLDALNGAGNSGSLTFGLLMNRGSITFDNARLKGTVAPEPISMALMAAGMVGLPFARRLRKTLGAA